MSHVPRGAVAWADYYYGGPLVEVSDGQFVGLLLAFLFIACAALWKGGDE